MQKGEEQFNIIYFSIEILERYVNNPKYLIIDHGYRGKIDVKDDYWDEESLENEYIRDYGMAYIDGNNLERAVGVFASDLAKLSSQKQILWKAFELQNQENCMINPGFIDNLIKGNWVNEIWIFHALIDEMKTINTLCEHMRIPKLFNKTFGTHYSEIPEGYRNMLLPTLKNYYDFILVLEKIIVHNISYKTFQTNAPLIQSIDRKDQYGENKGSLQMLDEWLNKNIQTTENLTEIIVQPLNVFGRIESSRRGS